MADRQLRRTLRIWLALARAGLRSELQYRANFALGVLGGFAMQGIGLAFIGTILTRVNSISGWTLSEVTLLYGMRLTSHGLWTVPFSNLMVTDQAVREAEFDRYLTRPINPFVQLATRRLQITTVSDLAGGIAVLTVGLLTTSVHWSPGLVVLLCLAILGGGLIELSFQTAGAALSFRMMATDSVKIALDDVFNTFGNYPIKIFDPAVRWLLTFLVPLAFASYLPATVILGRTDEIWIPTWLACCAPAVGLLLFLVAYRLWRWQLDHYSSTGN